MSNAPAAARRRGPFPVLLAVAMACAGLLLAAKDAGAATLFGVVTDRAAPMAAEAAKRHLAERPKDRIVLRTPAQLLAASDRELAQWLGQADALLAVAVFGDPARRLKDALAKLPERAPLLAMNGEQTLTQATRLPAGRLAAVPGDTLRQLALETPPAAALAAAEREPAAAAWLAARRTWQAGGADNVAQLFAHLLAGAQGALPPPQPEPALRLRVDGRDHALPDGAPLGGLLPAAPTLAVLDLANADPAPADALCAAAKRRGLACATVFARWGAASRQAVGNLRALLAPATPVALVVLQDFVVGAAENREAVTESLKTLDLPVIKAIRMTERSAAEWRLSPEGLPVDSVQYRVALPELQGSGQPMVVAAAGAARRDRLTGIELRPPEPLATEIDRLVARAARWHTLQTRPNHDKRVAIIYYNHPPGRQNIGADNLDVPASLFGILHRLKAAGYRTGELPATQEALLDRIMASGVNLPADTTALRELARDVAGVPQRTYARRFAALPPAVRGEMVAGPLGRLHAQVQEAVKANRRDLGRRLVDSSLKELHHLAAGAEHARRKAAIDGLAQLEDRYRACLAEGARVSCAAAGRLADRLSGLGIEGLRGWGPAPGKVMVTGERLLVPGIVFGNVFIGPQPPRGWEVDEELLHANTSVPPPHQYLAFYQWLREDFKADAVIHLGRHSTYEFLPGKAVGLTADDYPSLIAADLPGIYPYIVDGVGEGIQAKRRGLATIVDHLTPPLAATPLYDRLLELRQVVESFESANSESLKEQAAKTMREQVVALELKAELEASMDDVLKVRGIGFDQADDDLLAHEIGHYLTKLQEKFMPHGLHVFGRDWSEESLELMLDSMRRGGAAGGDAAQRLKDSPRQEMLALLAALDGRYVAPGKGNDPLRSPEALPTGRNFHAVDGDLLPTRLGYRLGREMRDKAMAGKAAAEGSEGSEAVILWASDAVRDEGVMVAFTLALMGAEPVWNARGIVTDVRLLPLAEGLRRRDAIVTTSGLFRDLYPNLLHQIDRAGRLALAASAALLAETRPELRAPLTAALAPLGKVEWGREPLAANRVAAQWAARFATLVAQGIAPDDAGAAAALRVFGDAPGAYGAGVNRLTERSGAWRERAEIGRAYLTRMGHAYGLAARGEAAHAAFDAALNTVTRSYHGRASNLYGLLDNNDAFDYLGGLSLAVETLSGRRPEGYILQHANPGQASVEPLATALLGELRGRHLNPAWIKPLMTHGYAGARTFGQEFLENLWGWQVTRPDLIRDWAWNDVKQVFFDDRHRLGLPAFLASGHNAHVKAHMLAIFMVAAQKGYWHPDDATVRRLGGELARLVTKNGLPGSGHTAPQHPMWAWLAPQLDTAEREALGVTLARARGMEPTPWATLRPAAPQAAAPAAAAAAPAEAAAPAPEVEAATRAYELLPLAEPAADRTLVALALLALLPLFIAGLLRGRQPLSPSYRSPS